MSLSDHQMLRLTTLCSQLADGTLSPDDSRELNDLLRGSAEARQFHIRQAALSASLYSYAAEMQSDLPPMPVKRSRLSMIALSASAFALLVMGAAWWMRRSVSELPDETHEVAAPVVASLSGTKDCEWAGAAVMPGAPLQAGQTLDLKTGFAEVTFDSGAQVTLEGPASLVVSSPWNATLNAGAVHASVPAEAEGFRLSTACVELVNSAVQFSMTADPMGAEVLVKKGSVAASGIFSATPVLLHESDSRRFADTGMTEVKDRERKFARTDRTLKLDRHKEPGGYTHWSFDDSSSPILTAETKGRKKAALAARLETGSESASAFTEGRWAKALDFNGRFFARTIVPGLDSRDTAHTLAFWVRVPEDASLAGGATILGGSEKKHGASHVRVAWNAHPALGSVGALRTEMGRAAAMGSTNLRDGHWHHIALLLVPGSDHSLAIRQYVDGRLDGAAVAAPAHRGTDVNDSNDTLFLGRAPGEKVRGALFLGALDELFVFDRALLPGEIFRLMRENRPPDTSLADVN
jgi:ferric-dicitrate binding protein FerR (iron transport regulator)